MKTKMMQLLTASVLLSAAHGLLAQDDVKIYKADDIFTAYVSIGQNFAQGHGLDLTQKTWGGIGAYTAEAGLQFNYNPQGIKVRPNLGYAKILGDYIEGKKTYDLFGIFVGFDIVYQPPSWGNVSFTMGPSFHFWSVEEVNFPGDARRGDRDGKFGWRLGVGYDITPKVRVDFTYTATEWRSKNSLAGDMGYATGSPSWVPGFNPSLPAYFTLKVGYKL